MSLLKITKTQYTQLAEQQPASLNRAVRARVMMEANRAVAHTKRLGSAVDRKYFKLWYYFPEA